MAKRQLNLDELDKINSISTPRKNAKLQGVISEVSPMKAAASGKSNYFVGSIADDTGSMRMVGFDAYKHQEVQASQQETILLENCDIKMTKCTSIHILQFPHHQANLSVLIVVILSYNNWTRSLITRGKVLNLSLFKQVKAGLHKQNTAVPWFLCQILAKFRWSTIVTTLLLKIPWRIRKLWEFQDF